MANPIWNARNWGVYQRAFPDMDWRKKWRTQNLGLASDRVTPKYDIDIGQHGKPRRDEKLNILRIAPSGPSGHHPGFESGYQGGVSKAIPSPTLEGGVEVTIEGGNAGLDAYPNKIPTVRQRKIPRTWRNPGGFQREDWGHWRATPRTLPNTGPPGLVPRMPTAPYQGMEPTATLNSAAMPKKKGFFGKMSPEELKDFQEVLKEMRLDIKPEFVAGGREGRTEQYSFLSFDQTPEQKKKREERQSLFSFLA